MTSADPLSLCWLTLPESRAGRELSWLAAMPGGEVTAIGERSTGDDVPFVVRPYRRLTRRFIEAGALAWFRGLDTVDLDVDWVASLELCALVSGQAKPLAERLGARRAVLTWGNDPRNPLYRSPLYRQALRRAETADLFVCLIEAAAQHCVDLGIPEERCAVVLPPLDTEHFHPPAEPVEEPVAIFVSSLAPNKGIDRVLDAFDIVRRSVPGARLRVVGRGPLQTLVEERAAGSGGAIEYVGALDRDGIAAELRRAAVFVTAPRPTKVWNEQFGLAYVEAMASGLPVVTTICGTNHEAALPPSLRVPDEAPLLAEALVTFLADPGLRRHLFPEVRQIVVERFERTQQLAAMRSAFDQA